jgi:glycerol-3-phosphate acyltransferase PlsY
MLAAILLILAGYLCGSLPFGVWVAKAKGIDLRSMGSGSTGATNVYRCVGKKEGILVLILDVLKGYAPVTAAIFFDHGTMTLTIPIGPLNFVIADIVPCIVGAMAMIGHSKSPFLGFTGGKSAATGLGTITALNPAVGASIFVVFVSLVYFTRLVSLASISAALSDVLFMALFKAPPTFIVYAAFGGLLVIIRHKANIQRLLNGTEPRFGEKAKEAAPESTKDAALESPKDATPASLQDAAPGSSKEAAAESPKNGSAESSDTTTNQVKADESKP